MAVADNKAVVGRLYSEVVSSGDLTVLDQITTDDMTDHMALQMGLGYGRDGFRGHIEAVRQAVPDFKALVDQLIGEDDLVVAYWRATGTAAMELLGIAPGTTFTAEAISRLRFEEGRIAEYQVMVGPIT